VAPTSPDQPLAASDRDAVKSSILPLLAASPSKAVTVQLGSTLKTLVARDYPEHWPGFLDSVKGLLGSGDIREVGAGCVASLELVKAFR
jgi:importin-7